MVGSTLTGVFLWFCLFSTSTWATMVESPFISNRVVTDRQIHASGVFLNDFGDILTAYHAVKDCDRIEAVKYRQVAQVERIAVDEDKDLAVLASPFQPYVSATFAQGNHAFRKGQPVFTEAYTNLRHAYRGSDTVFNAVVAKDDELSMLSDARPGASGSPVLGSAGLMLGMVVERVVVENRPVGKVMLSKPSARSESQASTQVRAVGADDIKQFLNQHQIAYHESGQAPLRPLQALAPRAATLSVGIICHKD